MDREAWTGLDLQYRGAVAVCYPTDHALAGHLILQQRHGVKYGPPPNDLILVGEHMRHGVDNRTFCAVLW